MFTAYDDAICEGYHCAKCNKPMRVAYGTKIPNSNNKRFYYMCTLKHNSGKTRCDSRNVNGIDLDTIVINKIKELANFVSSYL